MEEISFLSWLKSIDEIDNSTQTHLGNRYPTLILDRVVASRNLSWETKFCHFLPLCTDKRRNYDI